MDIPPRLDALPLWRLLVALADAERVYGATYPLTRRLAAIVQERLALDGSADVGATAEEAPHA